MKRRVIVGQSERVATWVGGRVDLPGEASFDNCKAIGLEENGYLVAGVVYDYFNGANINAHIAAAPGARWLTRSFLHFMFWYPFEQLKCRRITGPIPETNFESRRFAEHLGFELETKLKDAHPTGDVLVYRMFKPQCKWLNLRVSYEQTETTCHS